MSIPLGNHHFLLVASAQFFDLLLLVSQGYAKIADVVSRDLLKPPAIQPEAFQLSKLGDEHIIPDTHSQDEAQPLSVFGDKADSCADCILWRRDADFSPFYIYFTFPNGVDAKQLPHQFRSPRAY